MIKTIFLGASTMISSITFAQEPVQKLDEQFLLFLAAMEEVDGEWVHAVDLQEDETFDSVQKVNYEPGSNQDVEEDK